MKEPVWRNPPDLTELEGVARMSYFWNTYNLSTDTLSTDTLSTEDYGPRRDA